MIALVVLLIISILILLNSRDDPTLVEVKEKYKTFREHIIANGEEKYSMLYKEVPLVAYRGSMLSGVGYNSNKGGEIGICIDGTANQVFHVLLHELAHCTVTEYSHSTDFWDNYTELKNQAIRLGIYENINEVTPFCGKKIVDK
jgi:hypothetical protein